MPASTTYDLPIAGMTCASCAGRVERALRKVTGAEQVSVNLATEQARIRPRPTACLRWSMPYAKPATACPPAPSSCRSAA